PPALGARGRKTRASGARRIAVRQVVAVAAEAVALARDSIGLPFFIGVRRRCLFRNRCTHGGRDEAQDVGAGWSGGGRPAAGRLGGGADAWPCIARLRGGQRATGAERGGDRPRGCAVTGA